MITTEVVAYDADQFNAVAVERKDLNVLIMRRLDAGRGMVQEQISLRAV